MYGHILPLRITAKIDMGIANVPKPIEFAPIVPKIPAPGIITVSGGSTLFLGSERSARGNIAPAPMNTPMKRSIALLPDPVPADSTISIIESLPTEPETHSDTNPALSMIRIESLAPLGN